MKTYYFTCKNCNESIATYTADTYAEAVSFFAALKRLSEDVFLDLYKVI